MNGNKSQSKVNDFGINFDYKKVSNEIKNKDKQKTNLKNFESVSHGKISSNQNEIKNTNSRPSSSSNKMSVPKSSTMTKTSNLCINNNNFSISKKLKIPNVEERLVSFILDEIVDKAQNIKFSDIGNEFK
jgi:hypothetical protein